MNKSYSRMQAILLTIPSVAVLLTCNTVDAQVYKWRDNRGVIQYSDKPPVAGFTKASRNEIVNALQKKDLCAEPTAKTAALASATKKISANFFGAISSSGFGLNSKPVTTFGIFVAPKPVVVATALKPVVVAIAPKPVPVVIAPTSTPAPKPVPVVIAPTPTPAPAPAPSPSAGANIVQVGLMAAVDINKNITPVVGWPDLRLKTTGKQPYNGDIAFRIFCGISHMNNDDPLVFPNQQNATHHHTYFGNTSVNYKSDLNNLANVGNSTCSGGIMNRSAYWHPSMIDANGRAMPPDNSDGNGQGVLFYYKAGYDGVRPEDIKPVPKGLRMLTGNSKAKTSAEMQDVNYHCLQHSTATGYLWNNKSIPNCNVGDSVTMAMSFPRCWDGKNLDSPNHKDHMSTAQNGSCPATHPVPLPQITFNMRWKVTKTNEALTWRLASDNYVQNGSNAGYSAHADYVAAWDANLMAGLVKNCLNAKRDCGGDVIGDGRVFY